MGGDIMRISELIEALLKAKNDFGDLPVIYWHKVDVYSEISSAHLITEDWEEFNGETCGYINKECIELS